MAAEFTLEGRILSRLMLVRFFRFSLLVVEVLALLDDVLVDTRPLFFCISFK
jgi:hypothetical protein